MVWRRNWRLEGLRIAECVVGGSSGRDGSRNDAGAKERKDATATSAGKGGCSEKGRKGLCGRREETSLMQREVQVTDSGGREQLSKANLG
jgi:hypothetical protein